jgi:signal peptidase II
MNKKLLPYAYGCMFLILFFLERTSKGYALYYLHDQPPRLIINGIALLFSWNRGITWGFCQTITSLGSFILTAIIIAILLAFLSFTIQEYRQNKSIIPHLCVLVGGISNLVDRIAFGAVIDFILCYYKSWYWPVFNIADMLIVCGMFFIIGRIWYEHTRKSSC